MRKLLLIALILCPLALLAGNNSFEEPSSTIQDTLSFNEIRNLFQEALAQENQDKLASSYNYITNYVAENPQSVSGNGLLLRIEQAINSLEDLSNQGESFRLAGIAFYRQGQYLQAMEAYLKALDLFQSTQETANIGRTYFNIGLVYMRVKEEETGIQNYQSALTYSQQAGDSSLTANIAWALGNAYRTTENYLKAIEIFKFEESIVSEGNDLERLALVNNRIGLVYFDLGDYSSAENHFKRALMIYSSLGNEQWVQNVRANLGMLYSESGENNTAIQILRQIEAIQAKNKNTDSYHVTVFTLAQAYQNTNQNDSAIFFFERSRIFLEDSETTTTTFLSKEDLLKKTYRNLSLLYESEGDYFRAFTYQKAYADLNDQIINDPTRERVVELGNQYELKKAQEEVARLASLNSGLQNDLDAEYRNRITWALGGAAFTVMLLVLVFVLQRQSTIQSLIARLKS